MPSTHVDRINHWRIPAPVGRVWAAQANPESWPDWWCHVRAVRLLRPGDASGVGSVRRIRWSTRLPCDTVIEVEALEALRLERLRGRTHGPLRGEGPWLLRAAGQQSDVTPYGGWNWPDPECAGPPRCWRRCSAGTTTA
jgi:hypothetical protein